MGYTREYRMKNGMWSKSSKRFADRLETKVLKLGLGVGASLLSGGVSSKKNSRHYSYPTSYVPLTTEPYSTDHFMSVKSAIITSVVFLVLAPVFLTLGFVAYSLWGFWAFFSLLIFSTIALFCIRYIVS